MYIARTFPLFYPIVTGPGKQAYHISRGLGKLGHRCHLYTTTEAAATGDHALDLRDIEVTRLPVSFRFMRFDVAPSFPRLLFREEFDILHSHGYRDYLSAVAFATAKAKRKPFVLQPHGALYGYRYILTADLWKPYRYYDIATGKVIAKKASGVVVSTTQEREEAVRFGVEPERISIIPPGIVPYEKARKPKSDQLAVLFVGRISPSRRVDDIIRAFSYVARERPMRLTIVGEEGKLSSSEETGYYQKLLTLTNELGISDRVTFAGPKFGDDLEREYETSDVFVYASAYESFGQPLFEAAIHGLAIVTTRVGVARDIVVHGTTGALFEIGDVTQLARHILALASDSVKAKEMGDKVRAAVESSYSWDRIVRTYLTLYEKLVDVQ